MSPHTSPIALIAMDMDGTLLSGAPGRISPENLAALREAHQRNIHLAICSGRVADDAGFFAYDAGLPMHILALNGGCIMDRPLGDILSTHHMAPADVEKILALLDVYPSLFCCFADQDLVVNCSPEEAEGHAQQWGSNILRPGSRCTFHANSEGLDQLRSRGISKFLVVPHVPAHLPLLRDALTTQVPGIEVSSSWINNLELNPKGINKGTALQELADRLEIPMNQVMALGDNDNDIPMLQVAGYGVAMGNSTPGALASAAYVTRSCDQDGVAAAIRSLALGADEPGVHKLPTPRQQGQA